ncbi:hypothetical protein CCP4SC76_5330028 [Gammaproteobacteria bacterium]
MRVTKKTIIEHHENILLTEYPSWTVLAWVQPVEPHG